jgi:hypothetical protein
MTFQLPLAGFDAIICPVNEGTEGTSGCNQQCLPPRTDAIARSQSEQLSLWAIAGKSQARLTMDRRERW